MNSRNREIWQPVFAVDCVEKSVEYHRVGSRGLSDERYTGDVGEDLQFWSASNVNAFAILSRERLGDLPLHPEILFDSCPGVVAQLSIKVHN